MSGRSFDDFQFEHGFGHEIRRAVTRNPAPPRRGKENRRNNCSISVMAGLVPAIHVVDHQYFSVLP